MTLAVVVGMFAYGGFWLDERLGSKPWLLVVGILLGLLGGFVHLLRVFAPEMLPFGHRPKRPDPPPPG